MWVTKEAKCCGINENEKDYWGWSWLITADSCWNTELGKMWESHVVLRSERIMIATCMCVCVLLLLLCVHKYVGVHLYMGAHAWGSQGCWMSGDSITFPFIYLFICLFLSAILSLSWGGDHWFGYCDWPNSTRDSPVPNCPELGLWVWAQLFDVGVGDLNSEPSACGAGTLWTEQSPKPCWSSPSLFPSLPFPRFTSSVCAQLWTAACAPLPSRPRPQLGQQPPPAEGHPSAVPFDHSAG